MTQRHLPWLDPGDPFPPIAQAWGPHDPIDGLLAGGADLAVPTLVNAYRQGIFPWFSPGQPILWWSPSPRMVLATVQFRFHRSLRQTLKAWQRDGRLVIRFDHAFERVISHCAAAQRPGQSGTWIVPDMVAAYIALHRAGHAHSVETWLDGELAGGLYAVNLGGMVFGESMFALRPNASKIALSALVAWSLEHGIPHIDCQQETAHLAHMGAAPIPREDFAHIVAQGCARPTPTWRWDDLYWQHLVTRPTA